LEVESEKTKMEKAAVSGRKGESVNLFDKTQTGLPRGVTEKGKRKGYKVKESPERSMI